ncbi:MAG: endonuclease/exonuclease/phosphatase family protein [Candidatus Kapabacteria bacterium]|nr:endonuclease/exonuclease/phosphatase family protein [Candidatus Kapabacteria bacterium]
MRLLWCSLYAFGLYLLTSCSGTHPGQHDTVNIATFNVEWLGDGNQDRKPRGDADYLAIADLMIKTDADVLALQEIENEAALRKVLRYMPDYTGLVLAGAGQQNTAVVWKQNAVAISSLGPWTGLEVDPGRSRPGFVLSCKKGSFDWIMMVVHLKSTSRFDSTNTLRERSREVRAEQAKRLVAWSDSVQRAGKEQDVIIAGDFNDFPGRKQNATLTALVESSSLHFLTASVRSCRDPKLTAIDHIVASSSARARFVVGSERIDNFRDFLDAQTSEQVSDHCPVVVTFTTIGPDND